MKSVNPALACVCTGTALTVLLLTLATPTWSDEMPPWMRDRTNEAIQNRAQMPSQLPQPDNLTDAQMRERTRQALDAAAKASNSGLPQVTPTTPVQNTAMNGAGNTVPAAKTTWFEPETLARKFAQSAAMAPNKEQKVAPLIFISLSMPEASLKNLAQDASRVGAPLVLRGLVDGSLMKTSQALSPYSRYGVEIIIHPQAFEQYGVKVVPTFVVDAQQDRILPQSGCAQDRNSCNTLPRVEGDVSLAFALKQMNRINPRPDVTQWISTLERRQQ